MTREERIGWLKSAHNHLTEAMRDLGLAWGDDMLDRYADSEAIVRTADASSLIDRAMSKLKLAVKSLGKPRPAVAPDRCPAGTMVSHDHLPSHDGTRCLACGLPLRPKEA